ncbi:hypothetical protein SLH46_18405 [Draconibacterium sp. IB214405]|uniref:hypothetical protein n=1 Tax=Draconibacterium sp. IB214405 TaxID=3097352 RepID=UPI002A12BC46|nr:hypothetical protein [Draconibacterium sp. IB214405]MDX8341177.1 hypothetical protein [Draconibacterium sp. IB214405]
MKSTTLKIGNKEIPISDLYSFITSRLSEGEFDANQTKAVLEMLSDLDWIEPAICGIPLSGNSEIYRTILTEMKKDILQVHSLGWSAMCHFFSEVGVNTREMVNTINASEKLRIEIESSILYELICN